MGRHIHQLRPGVLEGALALALASALGLAYLASRPQTTGVSRTVQEVQKQAGTQVLEMAEGEGSSAKTSENPEVGVSEKKEPKTTAEPEPEPEPEPELEPEPEPEPAPEPEPEPVDPKALSAGDVLTPDEVERAGGEDVFFWSEEISDAVFARMEGKTYKADCTVPRSDLRYLRVLHKDAAGAIKVGELVVHRNVTDEVIDIFRQLYDAGYPIRKMHLADDYDADDERSCADDNTSSFNYRLIEGTSTISNHAYGLAIDINPFENPYIIPARDYISPAGSDRYADRSLREPYMIHADDLCCQLFVSYGWGWGGNWSSLKDYQHFEKPDALWY